MPTPILAVGSVALDTVETPFGSAEGVIGGSATYFAAAASLFESAAVQVVGVVGRDYPLAELDFLAERGVDLSGLTRVAGESFAWKGRYHYDLNMRDTVWTRLGVFADFRPRIPEDFRASPFVFLGNIDPVLQLEVLEQMAAPALVACDTMNFWIEGSRDALLRLLARVDLLMVNDAEARQLADEPNLLKAARWIQARGPRWVVIKKGEHGAVLHGDDRLFFVPGFPLESALDPTGAGDAFAGGFMGWLAQAPRLDSEALRQAVVYGSATGSFAVEAFSVDRFRTLTLDAVARRVEAFREMTFFEHETSTIHG